MCNELLISEKDADQLGIQYLWNSGYDPNAFSTLHQRILEREKQLPPARTDFFRILPSTEDRVAASVEEQRYLPPKDHVIVNTPEFDAMKSRLLQIDKH